MVGIDYMNTFEMLRITIARNWLERVHRLGINHILSCNRVKKGETEVLPEKKLPRC